MNNNTVSKGLIVHLREVDCARAQRRLRKMYGNVPFFPICSPLHPLSLFLSLPPCSMPEHNTRSLLTTQRNYKIVTES
jgi:hypothetical protein